MKKIIAVILAVCVAMTLCLTACGDSNSVAEIVYMVDGEVFTIQDVTESTDGPIETEPKKDGYRFVGWYEDVELTDRFDFDEYFGSDEKKDVVVYAKFTSSGHQGGGSGTGTKVNLSDKTFSGMSQFSVETENADDITIIDSILRPFLQLAILEFESGASASLTMGSIEIFSAYTLRNGRATFANMVTESALYELTFKNAVYDSTDKQITVKGEILFGGAITGEDVEADFSFVLDERVSIGDIDCDSHVDNDRDGKCDVCYALVGLAAEINGMEFDNASGDDEFMAGKTILFFDAVMYVDGQSSGYVIDGDTLTLDHAIVREWGPGLESNITGAEFGQTGEVTISVSVPIVMISSTIKMTLCETHVDSNGDLVCDDCQMELPHKHIWDGDHVCRVCGTRCDGYHVDNDNDYFCDYCPEMIEHMHKDADRNHICDLCGTAVDPCELGYHIDANDNLLCDDCNGIMDTTDAWEDLFGEIDDFIMSTSGLGKVSTLGGNVDVTANISNQDQEERTLALALDFGIDTRGDVSASYNAFGFTVSVDNDRRIGLWYVDEGVGTQNYFIAQFGDKVFKIKAQSAAQVFNHYPINADFSEEWEDYDGLDLSGIADILGVIFPLRKTVDTDTVTGFELRLTDFAFNKVGASDYVIGSILQGLVIFEDLFTGLGIDVDGSYGAMEMLDDLFPGLTLTLDFVKTNGVTSGIVLGYEIDGETTSIPLTGEGALADIYGTSGGDVVLSQVEDATIEVEIDYEFGDNSDGKYCMAVMESIPSDNEFGADADIREIGMVNFAIDADMKIGPYEYTEFKLAADIDPTKLIYPYRDAYVIDENGIGVYVDKNGNGQYDNGEEKSEIVLNGDINYIGNAADMILASVDSFYLKFGDSSIAFVSKEVDSDGYVRDFTVDVKGMSGFVEKFINILDSAGIALGGNGIDQSDLNILANLNDGTHDIASIIKPMICSFIRSASPGISYDKPASWTEEIPSGAADSDGVVDFGYYIANFVDFIDMFNSQAQNGEIDNIKIESDDFHGLGLVLNADIERLYDIHGNYNGVEVDFNDGITIGAGSNEEVYVAFNAPLVIGGDRIFDCDFTISNSVNDYDFEFGIKVNAIGYGIVNDPILETEEFDKLFNTLGNEGLYKIAAQ